MKNLLLTLLFVGTSVFAQIPSKLEELKSKREAAIKRIEDVYKDELKKLLNDPFIKGDPAKLAEVLKELGEGLVEQKSTVIQPPMSNKELERLFVNKSWFSTAKVEYRFEKDGKGYRSKIPLSWRILSSGLVEVTSRFAVNAPNKIWFFKFNSKKEAYFGESENEVTNPLSDK